MKKTTTGWVIKCVKDDWDKSNEGKYQDVDCEWDDINHALVHERKKYAVEDVALLPSDMEAEVVKVRRTTEVL